MNVLKIKNLNKTYPGFKLSNVNMTMEKGYIMGFIGENGAGKTTVLKTMLNIVKRESGKIQIFGKDIDEHEIDIKQDFAFMAGDMQFYPKKKLHQIAGIFRSFYKNWDDEIYKQYLNRFKLDESKKVSELSQGMRIKFYIALALSHKAKLLILDEPTSGLDPVARDMLLDIFRDIIQDGEHSILFSTHITSDLEKCADYITFIQEGQIVASSDKDYFIDSYKIISGDKTQLNEIKDELISYKVNSFGFTGMISTHKTQTIKGFKLSIPTLEDIMVYHSTYGGN